jgi:RNA polymerase sigma factor (sigma-70 family)
MITELPLTPSDPVTLRWAPLVEAIRQHDSNGMAQLYFEFSRGLRFLIFRQLGDEDVDDVLHQSIADVIAAVQGGGLAEPECLPGLVRTIVRRTIFRRIEERAETRATRQDVENLDGMVAVSAESPERIAERNELRCMVQKMLSKMRPRDREILSRFYVDDQPIEQICVEMGLSAQQFKNIKHRAKEQLVALCRADTRSARFSSVPLRRAIGLAA